MRVLLTLTAMLLFSLPMSALHKQIRLQGVIQDGFLKTGLFDCKVSLMRADSTVVDCEPQVLQIGSDSMHVTTLYIIETALPAGDYLIHVTKAGYDDGWASIVVPEDSKDGQQIDVPMIEIEKSMRSVDLKEVVVKATKIKVKMRGDTLVYDATAFNLPEGSMLENLIEQLPGARMTDAGEIFINGRKIDELTLSSRSLFRGDKTVLLKNLPYFTVKELKVFERQSLLSAMSGTKDENPEYVMDVVLKNEYQYGLISNADLGGGTHERYFAKLFGILIAPRVAFCAFANLNNVNDSRRAGLNAGWNPSQGIIIDDANKPSTRQLAGVGFEYQSEEKIFGFPVTTIAGDLNFDRHKILNESQTYNERFLQTGTAFGRVADMAENRITTWQSKWDFSQWKLHLKGSFHLGYREDNNDGYTDITQWDTERTTATQQTAIRNRMRLYGLTWFNFSFPFPAFKKLRVRIDAKWLRYEKDGFSRQTSNKGMSGEYYRHEYQDWKQTVSYLQPTLSYDQKLWNNLYLILSERYNVSREKGDDNLFTLSSLEGWGMEDSTAIDLVPSNREKLMSAYDRTNSSYSNLLQQENEFTPMLKWNKNDRLPVDISLSFPLYLLNERLDYRRDAIDTLARRNMFVVNPSLRIKHSRWSAQIAYNSSTPGIRNLIPYSDSRNPLNITETNPSLKNNRRINARANWKHNLRKNESTKTGTSSGELTSEFTYHINSVAQGFTYNNETGAYTFRPENVEGNWSWTTSYDLTLPLGSSQKWWIDGNTKAEAWHSVDYASVSGMEDAQLNKVETTNLSEWVKVRYVGKDTKASLLGDVRWRRTWGHRPTQESISAVDYRYGFTVNHRLPRWNTTFDVDACMFSRRGYASAAMNKDEFVVNASVSQSLMKGKVILTLEAHDLFNQISNTMYEVNAQGRTEKWYRVTPNYVMLSLKYRFNRNPKKL